MMTKKVKCWFHNDDVVRDAILSQVEAEVWATLARIAKLRCVSNGLAALTLVNGTVYLDFLHDVLDTQYPQSAIDSPQREESIDWDGYAAVEHEEIGQVITAVLDADLFRTATESLRRTP